MGWRHPSSIGPEMGDALAGFRAAISRADLGDGLIGDFDRRMEK